MERKSTQLSISCNEPAAYSNNCIAAWNTGPVYKSMVETKNWPGDGSANVPNSQFIVDKQGFQAPVYGQMTGLFPVYAPSPFSSASRSPGVRGFLFPKEGNQSLCSPASNGTNELGLHGGSGRIADPGYVHPQEFDARISEECRRRYVMFDYNGSKRRMIFHPSLINGFSPSLRSSGSYLPSRGVIPRELLVESPVVGSITPLGASFGQYVPHLLPMPRSFHADSQSSAINNGDVGLGIKMEGMREESVHSVAEELSIYPDENSEDLEALLSSDDDEESSTGHSPSDLTRSYSLTSSDSTSGTNSISSSKKCKKRRKVYTEDDTSSTATSTSKKDKERLQAEHDKEKLNEPTCCKDRGNEFYSVEEDLTSDDATHYRQLGKLSDFSKEVLDSHEATHYKEMDHGKDGETTMFDPIFPDEVSSNGSAINQTWKNNLSPMQRQSVGQSRKEKIKSILRLLRGVIPGGESMDTTFVLDEAIQYVKTLQFEVQKLQARKPN